MKYEKPDLEEIELLLEGSFLSSVSNGNADIEIKPGEGDEDTEWN